MLCLGDLMIVLDQSIVNVALPSIRTDLGFSQASLAWVVNAYLLTFGGFLLLSGRLGDLLGNKRVFLGGVVSFTIASAVCGLAPSASFLVVGRAVQGLAGATVSAVALALIMGLFSSPGDRAKAMGVFGFVMSGGGAVGVLAGGVLTGLLNWHWIFLVNVPVGVAVVVAARAMLPADDVVPGSTKLDVPGAVLVTSALMLAVYAVVGGNEAGWASTRTLVLLAAARRAVRRLRRPRDQGGRAAGPAAALQAAQRVGLAGGRRPLGRRDVRLVLPGRALPPAGAGLQRPRGRPRVRPDQPGDDVLLAEGLRPAGHEVRHPAAADRRAGAGRRRRSGCSRWRRSTATS